MIVGLECAVCGAKVDVATLNPFRCPRASVDDPHHVLHLIDDGRPPDDIDDPNPFVRYGRRLAWWAFAGARGMSTEDRVQLTRETAAGFVVTPLQRSDPLSTALGLDMWVKDETGNVAGSHKARHLIGILLHLRAAETLGLTGERPPLAIASCGNAAIAAATLAARADWPLDVYVPDWIDDVVGTTLTSLGARIHRCPRRPSDPPGDPAMLRFREAVAGGAIPFTVQGPENALCLDAGRTLGWEIGEAGLEPDRAFIQVGGGALAACVGAGLGSGVRLHAVQAAGCAPLAAAWQRLAGFTHPEQAWSEVMKAWPGPDSAADGILDDETYDWIADVGAMRASGGDPVVASEDEILAAHRLAREAGYDVSVTGSAGLAGVLAARSRIGDGERIVVVMSGVAR